MALWYAPTPVPYRPHDPSWQQPLHLHLHPLWSALEHALAPLEGRVIDVGCGTRPYRALMPKITGYVGVDRAGTGADVEADAHALPFDDDGFDAGVSFQVFEHVRDPGRCLRELARVVRPGGALVVTVPGVWPAHEVPHDYWRFTEFGLRALADDAGLHLDALTPLGGLWATLGQMANLELDRAWPGRMLVPLVNLAARALDRRPHHALVMNWMLRAHRSAR